MALAAEKAVKQFQRHLGTKEAWWDKNQGVFENMVLDAIKDILDSKLKQELAALDLGQRVCHISTPSRNGINEALQKRLSYKQSKELQEHNINNISGKVGFTETKIKEVWTQLLKDEGFICDSGSITWSVPLYFKIEKDIDWNLCYDYIQLINFHHGMLKKLDKGELEPEGGGDFNAVREYHSKNLKYYWREVRKLIGIPHPNSAHSDDAVVDMYEKYKEEIELWETKNINKSNLGKEPTKKLKLGDPRKEIGES